MMRGSLLTRSRNMPDVVVGALDLDLDRPLGVQFLGGDGPRAEVPDRQVRLRGQRLQRAAAVPPRPSLRAGSAFRLSSRASRSPTCARNSGSWRAVSMPLSMRPRMAASSASRTVEVCAFLLLVEVVVAADDEDADEREHQQLAPPGQLVHLQASHGRLPAAAGAAPGTPAGAADLMPDIWNAGLDDELDEFRRGRRGRHDLAVDDLDRAREVARVLEVADEVRQRRQRQAVALDRDVVAAAASSSSATPCREGCG